VTYRTQENPYAQAVAAARQAVEIRDAARELDWQRGRAEAVAALRDFAEVITPAVVDLDVARSGRVSLCVRSPDDRVWVARHLCEIVWDSAAGRWLRIGAPVDEDDGTLAAILMRVSGQSPALAPLAISRCARFAARVRALSPHEAGRGVGMILRQRTQPRHPPSSQNWREMTSEPLL